MMNLQDRPTARDAYAISAEYVASHVSLRE